MKTLTALTLSLTLLLTTTVTASAANRYQVDAARRAATRANYQVEQARRALFNYTRTLGSKWNRVVREARFKNAGRTNAAKNVFRGELNVALSKCDAIIQLAYQAIRSYDNQWRVEASFLSNGQARRNWKKVHDQNVQRVQRTIAHYRGVRAQLLRYWNSHLARVF